MLEEGKQSLGPMYSVCMPGAIKMGGGGQLNNYFSH